jgi:hypothetical protein
MRTWSVVEEFCWLLGVVEAEVKGLHDREVFDKVSFLDIRTFHVHLKRRVVRPYNVSTFNTAPENVSLPSLARWLCAVP